MGRPGNLEKVTIVSPPANGSLETHFLQKFAENIIATLPSLHCIDGSVVLNTTYFNIVNTSYFFANELNSLLTAHFYLIICHPWFVLNHVKLFLNPMHATVPFYLPFTAATPEFPTWGSIKNYHILLSLKNKNLTSKSLDILSLSLHSYYFTHCHQLLRGQHAQKIPAVRLRLLYLLPFHQEMFIFPLICYNEFCIPSYPGPAPNHLPCGEGQWWCSLSLIWPLLPCWPVHWCNIQSWGSRPLCTSSYLASPSPNQGRFRQWCSVSFPPSECTGPSCSSKKVFTVS